MKPNFAPVRAIGRHLSQLLLVALSITLMSETCSGALTLYNGFVVLNPNNVGITFYDVAGQSSGNPDFSGTLFTVTAGQTIKLGGEVSTSPGNGAPSGADFVRIYYKIDSGSFSFINLPFVGNVDANNDKWQQAGAGMVEFGSSLSAGTHTLTVYFLGHDNTDNVDAYLSNGGANYSATIQVVPEPTTIALGIFAGIFVISFCLRKLPRCHRS